MMRLLAAFVIGLLVGVGSIYFAPIETLARYNKGGKFSSFASLTKDGAFGQTKTALFFGYGNNLEACSEFKAQYTNKCYKDVYYCDEI